MNILMEQPMSDNHQITQGTMPYTLDATVGGILDDTNAVKILEKHIPGVSRNPMPGLAKGMTLKSLLAMPQAKQAGIFVLAHDIGREGVTPIH
jgi:hypothetical protein